MNRSSTARVIGQTGGPLNREVGRVTYQSGFFLLCPHPPPSKPSLSRHPFLLARPLHWTVDAVAWLGAALRHASQPVKPVPLAVAAACVLHLDGLSSPPSSLSTLSHHQRLDQESRGEGELGLGFSNPSPPSDQRFHRHGTDPSCPSNRMDHISPT